MSKRDHLRTNKILAGILVAGLLIFAVDYISEFLYDVDDVGQEVGYAIDGDAKIVLTAGAASEILPSISPLLKSASVEKGAKIFKKCQTCHTTAQNGVNKVGPNLYEIVGTDIAARDNFSYSKALSGLDGVWDYEALNKFLLSPRKYAKGTKMSFAGLKKESDRADIILYLRSLSSSPKSLP